MAIADEDRRNAGEHFFRGEAEEPAFEVANPRMTVHTGTASRSSRAVRRPSSSR